MENDIVTAEQHLKKYEVEDSGPGGSDYRILDQALIEFAKLHVQAALEAAADNAVAREDPSDYGTGQIWVDEQSILTAYNLNQII